MVSPRKSDPDHSPGLSNSTVDVIDSNSSPTSGKSGTKPKSPLQQLENVGNSYEKQSNPPLTVVEPDTFLHKGKSVPSNSVPNPLLSPTTHPKR